METQEIKITYKIMPSEINPMSDDDMLLFTINNEEDCLKSLKGQVILKTPINELNQEKIINYIIECIRQ